MKPPQYTAVNRYTAHELDGLIMELERHLAGYGPAQIAQPDKLLALLRAARAEQLRADEQAESHGGELHRCTGVLVHDEYVSCPLHD